MNAQDAANALWALATLGWHANAKMVDTFVYLVGALYGNCGLMELDSSHLSQLLQAPAELLHAPAGTPTPSKKRHKRASAAAAGAQQQPQEVLLHLLRPPAAASCGKLPSWGVRGSGAGGADKQAGEQGVSNSGERAAGRSKCGWM